MTITPILWKGGDTQPSGMALGQDWEIFVLGLELACELVALLGYLLIPVTILILSRWAYHFTCVRWLAGLFVVCGVSHALALVAAFTNNPLLLLMAKLVIMLAAIATPIVFYHAWRGFIDQLNRLREADSPRQLLLEARRLRKELRNIHA